MRRWMWNEWNKHETNSDDFISDSYGYNTDRHYDNVLENFNRISFNLSTYMNGARLTMFVKSFPIYL